MSILDLKQYIVVKVLRSLYNSGNWCCLTIRLFEFAAYLEILVMYREGRSQFHIGSLQVKPGDLVGLFIWNTKTDNIPNVTSKFLSHARTRLLNMTWSNSRLNF